MQIHAVTVWIFKGLDSVLLGSKSGGCSISKNSGQWRERRQQLNYKYEKVCFFFLPGKILFVYTLYYLHFFLPRYTAELFLPSVHNLLLHVFFCLLFSWSLLTKHGLAWLCVPSGVTWHCRPLELLSRSHLSICSRDIDEKPSLAPLPPFPLPGLQAYLRETPPCTDSFFVSGKLR